MKLKNIVAAAAILAAGVANAAVQSGTNGNGSLVLLAFDRLNGTTTSSFFDLGYTLDSFATATGNAAATSTLSPLTQPGTTIVWNFGNGTITENGTVNTSLGTNNWSGALSTFLANSDAGERQWAVFANDTTGFGAAKRALISGKEVPTASDLSLQNATNTGNLAIVSVANDIFTPIAAKGTIGSADNGAYTFTAADGATTRANGYAVASDAWANDQRNSNKLGSTVLDNEVNYLWLADGTGAERILGKMTLDLTAQTFMYEVAAIPEPSTYALMGLGLVGIAFAARRRRAAV